MDTNELVKNMLLEVDVNKIVRDEVRLAISGDIQRELTKVVRTELEKLIETEIDIALNSPINTNDGWGKKEQYDSFEDLFKGEFKSRLDGTYEMKKTIRGAVEAKVTKLFNEQYKGLIDKFVASITEETKAGK